MAEIIVTIVIVGVVLVVLGIVIQAIEWKEQEPR